MNSPARFPGFLLFTVVLLWMVPNSSGPALAAPPELGASEAATGAEISDGLSYSNAVLLLESGNQQLMAAADREDTRRQERAASRGLRLPTVQLNARAIRIDEPIVIDLNDIRSVMLGLHPAVPSDAIPSFETQVQDDHYFQAGANLTWPIFTGGPSRRRIVPRMPVLTTRGNRLEPPSNRSMRPWSTCISVCAWRNRR